MSRARCGGLGSGGKRWLLRAAGIPGRGPSAGARGSYVVGAAQRDPRKREGAAVDVAGLREPARGGGGGGGVWVAAAGCTASPAGGRGPQWRRRPPQPGTPLTWQRTGCRRSGRLRAGARRVWLEGAGEMPGCRPAETRGLTSTVSHEAVEPAVAAVIADVHGLVIGHPARRRDAADRAAAG
jgi:hypothetical protein